MAFCVLMCR